jgi:type II secretory pathway pseudopilin PulG
MMKQHRPKLRPREAGTTLLELLIALALLALLSAYALGALSHLGTFNRAVKEIEDSNSVAAVAQHVRRAIEGSRVVFFTTPGAEARLAFIGEKDRISLVTDADSRLELGGLYLVQLGLDQDGGSSSRLVAFRRAFRPTMAVEPGNAEPVELALGVAALRLRYYGAAEGSEEEQWHEAWHSTKKLPGAVEVDVAFEDGRQRWPALVVTIPAAR